MSRRHINIIKSDEVRPRRLDQGRHREDGTGFDGYGAREPEAGTPGTR